MSFTIIEVIGGFITAMVLLVVTALWRGIDKTREDLTTFKVECAKTYMPTDGSVAKAIRDAIDGMSNVYVRKDDYEVRYAHLLSTMTRIETKLTELTAALIGKHL